MTKLTLVHSTKIETGKPRTKRRVRPDGYLQCNRCGSCSSVTLTNGTYIKNGKKQGGTIIVKDVCYFCYQKNIISPMMQDLEPVKKK